MNAGTPVNPDEYFTQVAAGLDGLELVPDDVLFEVVTRDGAVHAPVPTGAGTGVDRERSDRPGDGRAYLRGLPGTARVPGTGVADLR